MKKKVERQRKNRRTRYNTTNHSGEPNTDDNLFTSKLPSVTQAIITLERHNLKNSLNTLLISIHDVNVRPRCLILNCCKKTMLPITYRYDVELGTYGIQLRSEKSLLARFDNPGILAHEPQQCILGSTSTSLVLDIWNIGTVFTLLAS